VYLNKLFSNAKIDVNNNNFVKLEAGSFTIDVASESEMPQSHITQIRMKTSSNFQVNIDAKPQVYRREYVSKLLIRLEVLMMQHKLPNMCIGNANIL